VVGRLIAVHLQGWCVGRVAIDAHVAGSWRGFRGQGVAVIAVLAGLWGVFTAVFIAEESR
jgi:hypothetical protein